MERLQFSSDVGYSALEAAIHLGRYAIARSICAGKRVLDVACGEGYGSYQLAAWGAASVDGVDISEEAIAEAQRRFSDPRIRYHHSDATSLDDLFPDNKFDLIISLETIEHLTEPEKLLSQIKNLLAPGGTIIISCPNDNWYYGKDESNPYHIRKYTFNECRSLAESVLGPAASWRIGTLTAGFVSVRLDDYDLAAAAADDQSLMLRSRDLDAALLVPAPHDLKPTTDNCSFFVGVWGGDAGQAASVTYPLSMDASGRTLFGGERVADLQAHIAELQRRCHELAAETERSQTAPSQLEGIIGSLRAELQTVPRQLEEIIGSLKAELQAAQAVINDQRRAIQDLTHQGAALTDDLHRREEIRAGLEASLSERVSEVGRLEQERRDQKAELEELKRALRHVSLQFHATRTENEVLRTRARAHLVEAEQQAERAREHHAYAEQQAERARERHAYAEHQAALAREAHKLLDERNAEIRRMSQAVEDRDSRLGLVPWRVVGVYRKMRPLVPLAALRGLAAVIDRSRRTR